MGIIELYVCGMNRKFPMFSHIKGKGNASQKGRLCASYGVSLNKLLHFSLLKSAMLLLTTISASMTGEHKVLLQSVEIRSGMSCKPQFGLWR
jgi:hypothetical protein